MKFEDFIGKGQVRKASKDISLAKSLVKTAYTDLEFLNTVPLNENSARKVMGNYYDVLRFLKEKGEVIIAEKFDRFRKLRNKINYYGKDISIEEAKENSDEIKKIINVLKLKYLEGI